MESDETIEVTDKRRVHLHDGAEAPAQTEPDASVEEDGPSLPAMDVYGLLKTTIGLLSSGAWAWMGLSPSPFTGQMGRDLDQAKVAIDTVAFLVDKVDSGLTDDERRDLRNTVSMLRVNFVQQTTR
jgi:hypothetical protein